MSILKPSTDIKTVFVYVMLIIVSAIALALVAISPPEFLSNHVVYQGF